jgi:hypothetical protein
VSTGFGDLAMKMTHQKRVDWDFFLEPVAKNFPIHCIHKGHFLQA